MAYVAHLLAGLAIVGSAWLLWACATVSPTAQLDRVWAHTLLVLPPSGPIPAVDTMPTVLKNPPSPPSPWPVVLHLHGCAGFGPTDTMLAMGIAKHGFAVIAPSSFARTGRTELCGRSQEAMVFRHEEVESTLRRIQTLKWLDHGNVFLTGFSEGGIAVSQYSGAEFNAYVILGWSCRSAPGVPFDRIHIPPRKPVLAVVGDQDETLVGPNAGDCGARLGDRPGGSKSVVLKDTRHDVTARRETFEEVGAFLKRNLRF